MGAGSVTRGSTGRDRGSGTVLALGAIGVLLVLLTALLGLGGVAWAMAQARSAADAAALAAARTLLENGGEAAGPAACARAAEFAEDAGARITGCRVSTNPAGLPRVDVRVEVDHRVPGLRPASAWARAGGVPGAGVVGD